MANRLPENWSVKNDQSDIFKNTVVKYINEITGLYWAGEMIDRYYGMEGGQQFYNPTNPSGCKVLTIDEFIRLTSEPKEISTFKFC